VPQLRLHERLQLGGSRTQGDPNLTAADLRHLRRPISSTFAGRDPVVGKRTGNGKIAFFVKPILQMLSGKVPGGIACGTRNLASAIDPPP
jgi:hypothetical protein